MKSYLFVFNGDQATRRLVTSRLDTVDEVVNWIAFFDNALCLVSEVDTAELNRLIRIAIPDVQFIVTELESGKRNGWLPKSVWRFLNHPEPLNAGFAA